MSVGGWLAFGITGALTVAVAAAVAVRLAWRFLRRARWRRLRSRPCIPVREFAPLTRRERAELAEAAEAFRDRRGTDRVAAAEWAAEAMMREVNG